MALAPNDMGGTEHGNAMRLVTAHRSGDTAAFTEIVRSHYPTLLVCARRRLTNPQDAEDAVQEAFLRAYRRLETFGNGGDWRLGAWLNTILSNVCTDILTRRRPTAPFDEWADGQADERPDAVELVSDTVVYDTIAQAIATLPQSQRSAFLLRMVDDRPYDEVAATLGITEDNARARVARARSALQRTLSRSDALTGMLAAAPLFVAGSVRSALRRVFSSNAGNSAHATAASLAANASTATAEAATVTGGPVGSGVQMLGQLASTPVAQVALAASASASGRGSVVLGVVASLAAAGGLSVPAVAAVAGTAPSAAAQPVPHLASATKGATASSTSSSTTTTQAQQPAAATAPSTTPARASSAPAAPSWVAVAASATVNGRAAVTSGGSTSAAGGGASTSPSSTGSAPTSTATPPASTSPTSGTGTGGSILPIGTCTNVAGFPGVTAPTAVPPLSSDTLVAVMSTGPQSFISASGVPNFQTTGSMSAMSGSAAPVNVRVGTCLAAGGSILAVDMIGTTNAEVQLVGSLVSAPVASTAAAGSKGAVDYLFRGVVTQIAGQVLTGGRLPWNLTSSFVAELQVQAGNMASIEVVFLRTVSGATPQLVPPSSNTLSDPPESTTVGPSGSGTSTPTASTSSQDAGTTTSVTTGPGSSQQTASS